MRESEGYQQQQVKLRSKLDRKGARESRKRPTSYCVESSDYTILKPRPQSFIETGEQQDDRFTNNNNQNNSRRKSQASDKVEPILSGEVWHQTSGFLAKWKERFLILTQNYLFCYKLFLNQPGDLIWRIDLFNIREVRCVERRGSLVLLLEGEGIGRNYFRRTEGMNSWSKLIKNQVLKCKEKDVQSMGTTEQFWDRRPTNARCELETDHWLISRLSPHYRYRLKKDLKSDDFDTPSDLPTQPSIYRSNRKEFELPQHLNNNNRIYSSVHYNNNNNNNATTAANNIETKVAESTGPTQPQSRMRYKDQKNQNKVLRQELDEKIRQIKKSLEDLGLNAQVTISSPQVISDNEQDSGLESQECSFEETKPQVKSPLFKTRVSKLRENNESRSNYISNSPGKRSGMKTAFSMDSIYQGPTLNQSSSMDNLLVSADLDKVSLSDLEQTMGNRIYAQLEMREDEMQENRLRLYGGYKNQNNGSRNQVHQQARLVPGQPRRANIPDSLKVVTKV